MTEKQIIERLMNKVSEMRQAQKNYFSTKLPIHLKQSKNLESDVDDYLIQLRKKGYMVENGKEEKVEQKRFF